MCCLLRVVRPLLPIAYGMCVCCLCCVCAVLSAPAMTEKAVLAKLGNASAEDDIVAIRKQVLVQGLPGLSAPTPFHRAHAVVS